MVSEFFDGINDKLFQSIKKRYHLLAIAVKNEQISVQYEEDYETEVKVLKDSLILEQLKSIPKHIMVKFKNLPSATYHWYKHSFEDRYENKMQRNRSVLISPEEYLEEANDLIKIFRRTHSRSHYR